MLGTGNALVTECYNTCFVLSDGDKNFLVDGEADIYGHSEVLTLLEDIAGKLLQPKETRFINDRLHFIKVGDGETQKIIGKPVTFLTFIPRRLSSSVSAWILAAEN